ncbi:MAG: hypothetical protein CMP59_06550 [Flavobacteriales bacterium]|nr:hypothetical protein [Flavobacteriales bacterium]|tara:strand:+ start:152 stop:694 length:543 start_codon:yes stop_codon:yes gene_type:complete
MNKIKTLLLLSIITISQIAFAQVGDPFPTIKVSDLNEDSLTIPEDSKGKFTLVGVAFSEDAQNDLYTWSDPVFQKFMNDNNLNSLVYDPNVYLILMFTGVNSIAANKAKEKIEAGTDESLKDNIVIYKGKMEDYRKKLKMKDRKLPYFFVLDKEGTIIYECKGRYQYDILEKVGEMIEED